MTDKRMTTCKNLRLPTFVVVELSGGQIQNMTQLPDKIVNFVGAGGRSLCWRFLRAIYISPQVTNDVFEAQCNRRRCRDCARSFGGRTMANIGSD